MAPGKLGPVVALVGLAAVGLVDGETVLGNGHGIGPSVAQQVAPRLLGLVELPELFGTRDPNGPPGLTPPPAPSAIPVHAEPADGAPVVATLTAADSVEWREWEYEAPAAVAYGASSGWVRVAVGAAAARRHGWIAPEHHGSLHRHEDLLMVGLSYLTRSWDGVLREAPSADAARLPPIEALSQGAGANVEVAERDGVDVNVVEVVEREGTIWLRVELLAAHHCAAAGSPAVRATGWVPALAPDGSPNAWFHSRGC